MSRSYKHTSCNVATNSRGMKRIANHKVRQKLKSPNFRIKYKEYRKVTCSWGIREYLAIVTSNFDEYYVKEVAHWKMRVDTGYKFLDDTDEPPRRKEVWKEYCKLFRRK